MDLTRITQPAGFVPVIVTARANVIARAVS
jgi:hypothetical protein